MWMWSTLSKYLTVLTLLLVILWDDKMLNWGDGARWVKRYYIKLGLLEHTPVPQQPINQSPVDRGGYSVTDWWEVYTARWCWTQGVTETDGSGLHHMTQNGGLLYYGLNCVPSTMLKSHPSVPQNGALFVSRVIVMCSLRWSHNGLSRARVFIKRANLKACIHTYTHGEHYRVWCF